MTELDGVVYYDEPLEVNYIDFGYDHLGCDSIITLESANTDDDSLVVAYAVRPEFNKKLRQIFKERYAGGEYVIMKHIRDLQLLAEL